MSNYRSPKLLAAVRTLPCAHCGLPGPSEASHSNSLTDGKGMGIKAHDHRIAALCHTCHVDLDQGSRMDKQQRREFFNEAHRRTIGWLFDLGKIGPI